MSMLRTALRSVRLLHTRPAGKPVSPLKSRFVQGAALGLGIGLTYGLIEQFRGRIGLESIPDILGNVDSQPQTDGIAPFPRIVSIDKTPFKLLATGVRSVTFLNFHVYAVGLYIAAEDLPLAQRVLKDSVRNAVNEKPDANALSLLSSPETDRAIVDALLRENIRLAIRITPTRNTDFNHLRDGFVRSIMNQPEAKKQQSAEFGESIAEIKRAFGRKRKLMKGEVITWARDADGGMTAWYEPSVDSVGTEGSAELLGVARNADAARFFYLQYLTGTKPNSPSLRSNAVASLARITSAN